MHFKKQMKGINEFNSFPINLTMVIYQHRRHSVYSVKVSYGQFADKAFRCWRFAVRRFAETAAFRRQ